MSAISRPRGPYRTGVLRKVQIIDAAWRTFALRGYATASLREIADAVGVTPAAILRHYGSKEGLLIAVLDRWDLESKDLGVRSDMGDGLDYFRSFSALMQYHVEHPGLIELFLTLCAEASVPDHPARPWVTARYRRIVVDGVEHLRHATSIGAIPAMSEERMLTEVRALYAAMDGLELQWIANPEVDLVACFDGMFAFTLERWGAAPDPVRLVAREPEGASP